MDVSWSMVVLVLWIQVLTLSFSQQPQKHEAQHVYVSQSRGRDSQSCGPQSNPCKTIVMGVWRVQHDGEIYVDGTGTEMTPYTCKSSALELVGIHSNKSMVIIGVQSIPHVKCQEGYDIRLNQSLLDQNETTVQLTNLQFANTSVSAQDINLYIDNCIFTGAAQAVNLVQSTKAVALSFSNSICVNVSCCIATSITKQIATGNNISIYVTDSIIVASWADSSLVYPPYYSSGINVISLGEYDEYEPGSITCNIAIRNVTFKRNVFGLSGIIHLNLENGFTSLNLEDVTFLENMPAYNSIDIISIESSYNHDTILINTKFLQNYQGLCRALQVETKNRSKLFITDSEFERFHTGYQDGLLYLSSDHDSEVYIENTTFESISTYFNGACMSLTSHTARVTINDSTFRNNSAVMCGGIMWLSAKDVIMTTIRGCHFESISAGGPGGLAGFESKEVTIEIINSIVHGSTSSSGSGGIVNIGYSGCGSSIRVNSATLSFRNVQITSCCSYGGSGGVAAVKAHKGSITVQDSIIREVRADGPGGTFYAHFDSLSGPEIRSVIRIVNSTFKNSHSSASGGLLYSNAVHKLTLESVIFDSVQSGGPPGGGLYINTSIVTVDINNSVITNFYTENSPGGAVYFSAVSALKITNSVFESNAASNGKGGCLYLSTSTSDVLLRNVTFKRCYNQAKGGAIFFTGGGGKITIDSCKFYGNEAPRGMAGAIIFDFPNDDKIVDRGCIGQQSPVSELNYTTQYSVPHRVWAYNTSITIKNTIFADNVAINGGALSISRGNHTIQNCSFVNNFANLRGGHIFVTSDSTSLQIINTSFLQQRSTSNKVQSLFEQDVTFSVGSFIDSESAGLLIILNSTLQSSLLAQGETLVTVSKANFLNFGDNNQTVLTCPRGSALDILNFTTQVDTEDKSKECLISLNAMQFICKSCGTGTYSLEHGQSLGTNLVSDFLCLPCPFGAECLNKISAKPNFWGYKVQDNPPTLTFTLCPVGYCGQPNRNDLVDYNSCHGNRKGTLCGECKENYTETLLSPSCRRQDECRDTWFMGVAVVMVLLMALYLVHNPWLSRMLKSHFLWFRSNRNQENEEHQSKDDDRGGYLKIVFYFYQVANILLISTSYDNIVERYLFHPVVGLFNFEIRFTSRGLLCPFIGLTVVTKQLLFACPVFGVLLMIAVCYGCHCLLHKCKSKSRPTLGPYLGAALETLLLGFAVFANTALKLLRCTSVGEETRLFIAGNVLCYQWWQYLLMVFVAVVVLPCIVTLALGSHWLYKGSISIKEFLIGCVIPLPYLMYKLVSLLCGHREPRPEPPEWKASVTAVLYGPFRKPQDNTTGAIYWESILIFRRLVLIVIYVFVPDPLSMELLLTLSCVVILLHHTIVRPFRSQTANIAEMISLFGLVVIATINAFNASFRSFGQVPQGSMHSFSRVLNWIQTIILTTGPALFILAVIAAILSQLIQLVVKIWSSVNDSRIQSRDWRASDDQVRRLLEPSTCEDYDPSS